MGNKFNTPAYYLNAFCRMVGESINIEEITREHVNCFLFSSPQITQKWFGKYNALLGFYKFAISREYVLSSPLPTDKPPLSQPFVPYIYSQEELRRILDAIAFFRKQTAWDKLEPHTVRSILLLLYGAGLRISEALSLTLSDVDLASSVLTIRNTKFNKTRFVPIGNQLNQAMTEYLRRRKQDRHSQADIAPFFVYRTGQTVPIYIIERTFRKLCIYSGIYREGNARNQPRVHDLRHSFAIHRLTSWYRDGKDVQKLLPKLATYLGHINISATQVYLTMTPELLQEASKRFEQYAFKEVSNER